MFTNTLYPGNLVTGAFAPHSHMTVNEFRAWLEGFEKGIKNSPTKAQWQKIKGRLSEVTEGSHLPNYEPYYRAWWPKWINEYSADIDFEAGDLAGFQKKVYQIVQASIDENRLDITWSRNGVPTWLRRDLSFLEMRTAYAIGQIEANARN